MSIQEYLSDPYVGYLFMFGPITLYVLILAYAIYKDIDESRKYITFKAVKGSWSEFWMPMIVGIVLMSISPIGWFVILLLCGKIYKDGPLCPGKCATLAIELEEKNERMVRLENTCMTYREERDRLHDRCCRLEERAQDYRFRLETVQASSRNIISQVEERNMASQVNHKRLIMQIEKEIERIKRIS